MERGINDDRGQRLTNLSHGGQDIYDTQSLSCINDNILVNVNLNRKSSVVKGLALSAHALILPLKSPVVKTVAIAPISQLVVDNPMQGA